MIRANSRHPLRERGPVLSISIYLRMYNLKETEIANTLEIVNSFKQLGRWEAIKNLLNLMVQATMSRKLQRFILVFLKTKANGNQASTILVFLTMLCLSYRLPIQPSKMSRPPGRKIPWWVELWKFINRESLSKTREQRQQQQQVGDNSSACAL